MPRPDVYDNWERPPSKNEPGGGQRITESAGYMPVRAQVEMMIQAGVQLGDFRKAKYDFDNEKDVPDDVQPDITRSPGFDQADGSMLGEALRDRLLRQKADAEAALKALPVEIPAPEDGEEA